MVLRTFEVRLFLELSDTYENITSPIDVSIPAIQIAIISRLIKDELWFFADFTFWMEAYRDNQSDAFLGHRLL